MQFSFRYCLVDESKYPHKVNGEFASPNNIHDFVELEKILEAKDLCEYKSLGVSIQGSGINAIDVDHCFGIPFDLNSADQRALDIIRLFKEDAYIEFSFSGTGLRIFFKYPVIEEYENIFYIKNSSNGVEYYQPSKSFRYVTITGKSIVDNDINSLKNPTIMDQFLQNYMLRKTSRAYISEKPEIKDDRDISQLKKLVKYKYLTDPMFQNLWFDDAPGSGKNESERDFHLVAYLYENITKDRDSIKKLFEESYFYKSKDFKHKTKWLKNDSSYYNKIYNTVRGDHGD